MPHSDRNAAPQALVSVRALSKRFGRLQALQDVSLCIEPGELLGLIGPNGAGKTTLFECLAGVQAMDSGDVTFGASGTQAQQRSAVLYYLPDGIAPWAEQSTGWALDFALGYFGGQRALQRELVDDLALEDLLPMRIGALSKGQRKRVLLALGLLMPQPVLLIDEPFEGLDLRQSQQVSAILRKHVSRGRTLFVSVHQIAAAARLCDRFVLLSDGRVVAEGTLNALKSLVLQRRPGTQCADFEEVFLALT